MIDINTRDDARHISIYDYVNIADDVHEGWIYLISNNILSVTNTSSCRTIYYMSIHAVQTIIKLRYYTMYRICFFAFLQTVCHK